MASPTDEIIKLAQAYKVAPIGPESEKALAKLCECVEKLAYPTDPQAQRTKAFFG